MTTHYYKKYLKNHPDFVPKTNPVAVTYCGIEEVKHMPLNPRFDLVDCQKCLDAHEADMKELRAADLSAQGAWAARGHI